MANRRKDVLKFRKKPRAAVVIFTIILVYLIAFTSIYISKSKIKQLPYNTLIKLGTSSNNNICNKKLYKGGF